MIISAVMSAVVIAVVVLYVKMRKPGNDEARTGISIVARENAYHAVSVRPGLRACAAARTADGTRYLSREAPKLPLAACDEKTCTCGFIHHKDRRAREDRRSPFQSSIGTVIAGNHGERRRQTDRRQGDGGGMVLN